MSPLLNVLWNPKLVFQTMINRRNIFPLALSILGIDLVLSFSLFSNFSEAAGKAIAQNPMLTAGSKPFILSISILTAGIANFILLAFLTLLFLMATKIFNGSGNYRNILNVMMLGSAPSILYRILERIFHVFRLPFGTSIDMFSLNAILPQHFSATWHAVARFLNLFDIWSVILTAYGFSLVSGLRRRYSYLITAVIWGGFQLLLLRLQLNGGFGK